MSVGVPPHPERRAAPTLAAMLSEDQARELSRAAKQAVSWTNRRNELIREATVSGASLREIAKATGLNVATVHNVIKPRSR